uniref:Augerpeptide hhe7a n=1 Tax=Hastula hectica TaxID=745793 RepID=TE7A_HASHE|nr:RecName: Full=Augerpeptide hhe7a [Hastula hectica]
ARCEQCPSYCCQSDSPPECDGCE